MRWPVALMKSGLALLLLGGSGCIPARDGPLDEQKEPHYLRGQERMTQLDFRGAIESFERALELNPRSASAHCELGFLYGKQAGDPAAAIFHFERHLKLRPKSDRGDIVRQHIADCKVELAKSLLLLPGAPSVQKEMDKLKNEVDRLAAENAQLRRQLEARVAAAPAVPVTAPVVATTRIAASLPTPPATPPVPAPAPAPPSSKAARPAGARSHSVKSGEIPGAIARQYGVRVEALLAANPNVDPKRMRIGQVLVIPAP